MCCSRYDRKGKTHAVASHVAKLIRSAVWVILSPIAPNMTNESPSAPVRSPSLHSQLLHSVALRARQGIQIDSYPTLLLSRTSIQSKVSSTCYSQDKIRKKGTNTEERVSLNKRARISFEYLIHLLFFFSPFPKDYTPILTEYPCFSPTK